MSHIHVASCIQSLHIKRNYAVRNNIQCSSGWLVSTAASIHVASHHGPHLQHAPPIRLLPFEPVVVHAAVRICPPCLHYIVIVAIHCPSSHPFPLQRRAAHLTPCTQQWWAARAAAWPVGGGSLVGHALLGGDV